MLIYSVEKLKGQFKWITTITGINLYKYKNYIDLKRQNAKLNQQYDIICIFLSVQNNTSYGSIHIIKVLKMHGRMMLTTSGHWLAWSKDGRKCEWKRLKWLQLHLLYFISSKNWSKYGKMLRNACVCLHWCLRNYSLNFLYV